MKTVPQLSKVRIVNFYYNDGNRLIADELFDFRDSEKKKVNNVLLQLANGGGKSVLVQLMMQPVKPRAMAAGRKIESFFNKPGYHSYVVLEWKKDKSAEKLLTGISVRSSMNSDDERGQRIQYYTFISEYLNDYDPESIVSLELSSKVNGNFVSADYDYIKKISRNNNRISYYSQEKSREWKEKLQEYYIFPNEWEMIEKINQVEGGLEMFFSQYTNSDDLIDKLLIPAIENEIKGETSVNTAEDRTLTTMFLNYADKHLKSADLIEKQKVFESYIEQLQPFANKFENLYEKEDKARMSERKMFGLADSLVIKKKEQDDLKTRLENDKSECQKKLDLIEYEEVSAEFYTSSRNLEIIRKEKEDIQQEYDKINDRINSLETEIKIQECADYYAKQRQAESEADGIKLRIESIENESDISEQIKNLKYSVHIKAQNEIESLSLEKDRLDEEIKKNTEKKNSFKEETDRLESETEKLTKDTAILEGSFENQKKTTDSYVSDNNFDLTRNILGSYETADTDLLEQKTLKEKLDLQNRKTETEDSIKNISKQKDDILNSNLEIKLKLEKDKSSLKEINDEILKYNSGYNELCSICSEYGLKENSIFNRLLQSDIKSRLSEKEIESQKLKNEMKTLERLLNAAQNGCVHISKEVIDYLSEHKVEYITFEKYILAQIENGKIDSQKAGELLDQYPFLAYSMIIEDREYEKIDAYNDGIWFETAVPVFSMSEIGEMVTKTADPRKYIACYSRSLFEDHTVFLKETEDKKENLSDRLNVINDELKNLDSQLKKVEDFAYPENWYLVQTETVNRLNEEIKESNEKIEQLNELKESLEKETEEKNILKEKLYDEIKNTENRIKILIRIREWISDENTMFSEINSKNKKYKEALKSLNDFKEKLNEAEKIEEKLSEQITTADKKFTFAQSAFDETSSCQEAEIIDKPLEDLFTQYKEISAQHSNEIESLKNALKSKKDLADVYRTEIIKRKIDASLYESVIYSEQKKKDYEKSLDASKKELCNINSDLEHAKNSFIKAENNLEIASENLKKYGEPLPEETIKPDFEKRRANKETEMNLLNNKIKNITDLINNIERVMDRIKDVLDTVQRRENSVIVELENNLPEQFDNLKKERENNNKIFNDLLNEYKNHMSSLINDFMNDEYGLNKSLKNILELMNNKHGESIYSVKEMTDKYIDSAQKMVLKLTKDLSEITRDKKDLVHHCVLRAEQIHGGLLQLIKGSKITVYEDKSPKNMLKIDIPDKFDSDSAEKYIDLEIEKSVNSFVNTEFSGENKKRKEADKIVSSGRLLRTAVQKNALTVRAFKVDQSADNASYRTWEESLINNSGAEKFIVYLSIIVSIMNYSKSEASGIQNNSVFSALILDNPFGSTTSPHILLPMFNLAEHFKVQLICLTHITQNDVVKCFDNVIKIFLKKMAMSSKEIIVLERQAENETIAHGFYSVSDQLSLF